MTAEPRALVPPVMRAAWVNRSVADAFAVFTEEIGAWWPLPTHGLFGDAAATVGFRGDQLIEQSTTGQEMVWGKVLAWEPPNRLVIAWHPGRDELQASEVEVMFEADGNGTRVVIEHRGWETFGDDASSRRLGYVGPNAWGYVLDHYADGAEVSPDAVDVTDLAAAYDTFFLEASRAEFGPPEAGQWDAAHVVAHVALNDAAILAVCQALVHEKPARFENLICQDPDVLSGWVEASGDLTGLITRGRETARLTMAALRRLSSEQLATEVHCRLTHDGDVMVDRPMPWAAVAVVTQTDVHLPAHIDQLRDLRP